MAPVLSSADVPNVRAAILYEMQLYDERTCPYSVVFRHRWMFQGEHTE